MSHTTNSSEKHKQKAYESLFILSFSVLVYSVCVGFISQEAYAFEFVIIVYLWLIFWIIVFHRKKKKNQSTSSINK